MKNQIEKSGDVPPARRVSRRRSEACASDLLPEIFASAALSYASCEGKNRLSKSYIKNHLGDGQKDDGTEPSSRDREGCSDYDERYVGRRNSY
jgi:hypothetical protein